MGGKMMWGCAGEEVGGYGVNTQRGASWKPYQRGKSSSQGAPKTAGPSSEARKRQRRILPTGLKGNVALPTPHSWTSSPQKGEMMHIYCFKSPHLGYFFYGSPRKLIRSHDWDSSSSPCHPPGACRKPRHPTYFTIWEKFAPFKLLLQALPNKKLFALVMNFVTSLQGGSNC